MKFPFTIKAERWWDYLNPFWWQRKQKLERFLAYVWETQGLEQQLEIAMTDAVMYGEGRVLLEGWEIKQ